MNPLRIKCCATTQRKALLYIYRLRMINMLFVEQICRQINLFLKIFPDVSSLWRRLSITCQAANTNMQIWDEPWRLQTLLHNDIQGRTDMKTVENSRKELNNVCMNVSSTCRPKPERQCSTTIYYQHNSLFQRQKTNVLEFIIWPARIRVCTCKKHLAGHHDRRLAVRYFQPWYVFPTKETHDTTTHFPSYKCSLTQETHITREFVPLSRKQKSLVICVPLHKNHTSLARKHKSLNICVALNRKHIITRNMCLRAGEQISLLICVPLPRKHISLVICVPLHRKHIITRDMCSPTQETDIPSGMCSPTQKTHNHQGYVFPYTGNRYP